MAEVKEAEVVQEPQTEPTNEVAVVRPTISRALVSPEDAVKAWEDYQALASKICTDADVQDIGGKQFKKKSFWRKLDKFFGLSLELINEREDVKNVLIRKVKEERTGKGGGKYMKDVTYVEYYPKDYTPEVNGNEQLKVTFVITAVYRAKAPNGQYIDGDGTCDTWESGYPDSMHNVRATAHTRAKNRAIADLVGFGEVSAEEVRDDNTQSKGSSGQGKPKQSKEQESLVGQIRVLLANKAITEEDRRECKAWLKAPHSNKILKETIVNLEKMISDSGEKQSLEVEHELSDAELQVTLDGIGPDAREGNMTEGGE